MRYGKSFEAAAGELARAIESSVVEATKDRRRVAVSFSGGVDSSILVTCAKRSTQVVACGAWSPRSADERTVAEAAREIGVELVGTRLEEASVRRVLGRMSLPFEASPMDRALWCLYYIVSESAAASGAEEILLGQLADELFGGYAKYQRAFEADREEADQMMRRDVAGFRERGRPRDVAACGVWLPPRFPFEAPGVVELGLALPAAYKFRGGARKAVLRRAAVLLGVPERLAMAPKKAAQYSSGIQKLLR